MKLARSVSPGTLAKHRMSKQESINESNGNISFFQRMNGN